MLQEPVVVDQSRAEKARQDVIVLAVTEERRMDGCYDFWKRLFCCCVCSSVHIHIYPVFSVPLGGSG